MNPKILLILSSLCVCTLLLGGTSLAQAAPPAPAPMQGGRYHLETAAAPAQLPTGGAPLAPDVSGGGHYRLHSLEPQPALTTRGGSYRLSVAAPAATGCCCTYIPCVIKNP